MMVGTGKWMPTSPIYQEEGLFGDMKQLSTIYFGIFKRVSIILLYRQDDCNVITFWTRPENYRSANI